MASQISLLSSILLLILFHVLTVIDPACRASTSIPKQPGFRATLNRANLPKNRYLLNEFKLPVVSLLYPNGDEYTVDLNIGTPPVAFKGVIDTGSDLIWAKCSTNNSSFFSTTNTTSSSTVSVGVSYPSNYINKYLYSSSSSSPQNTSSLLFDPLKSQSFSKVSEPCTSFGLPKDCKMSYADSTAISYFMGRETLTMLGTTFIVGSVTLACGIQEGDGFVYDGIVGMGRGKVSLLSQLNERVFGYCLPLRFGDQSKTGVFVTGSGARNLRDDNMIQTMPLLSNSKPGCESYYYVSLEGISVGETKLDVTRSDFALLKDGTGGMIVDSGTTFTYLEDRIVGMIKDEFLKQTMLEKSLDYKAPYDGLDLCFNSNDVALVSPTIVFHFEGADWEMPIENYMYKDASQPQACFAMMAARPDDKISILGNMQQQNMVIVFDLDSNTLSFKPEKCSNESRGG